MVVKENEGGGQRRGGGKVNEISDGNITLDNA